jgi:hypothetical protein
VVSAFVSVDEVLQEKRNVAHLQIAALAQFMGDVHRNVLRPSFSGVETDDADWIFVLTIEQIDDHGFKVRGFDVGFAPCAALRAKVVDDKVDGRSSPLGTIDGVQVDRRIANSSATEPGTQ